MAKANTEWKVLAHDPIEKLADNLWRVSGSLPGMSLKRTMTVARLKNGDLVIHNPIALDPKTLAELEAWGKPAFVVVPNGMHRLDAPAFKKRYPDAVVLAPKGSRAKVEQVLAVDTTCDAYESSDDTVQFQPLHGVADAEVAMLVRSADGITLVLTDVMFNMQKKKDFFGYLFTTVMGSAPGPRVSRLGKLLLVKDKKALREDFERFAKLPDLARVIVAHEDVAQGPDARLSLERAATYL